MELVPFHWFCSSWNFIEHSYHARILISTWRKCFATCIILIFILKYSFFLNIEIECSYKCLKGHYLIIIISISLTTKQFKTLNVFKCFIYYWYRQLSVLSFVINNSFQLAFQWNLHCLSTNDVIQKQILDSIQQTDQMDEHDINIH